MLRTIIRLTAHWRSASPENEMSIKTSQRNHFLSQDLKQELAQRFQSTVILDPNQHSSKVIFLTPTIKWYSYLRIRILFQLLNDKAKQSKPMTSVFTYILTYLMTWQKSLIRHYSEVFPNFPLPKPSKKHLALCSQFHS